MKKGWTYKKFKDICYSISDGDWIEKKDQSHSGIRLIQTGNIGVGVFIPKDDSQRFISEETFKRLRCTEIFKGDILISRLPNPLGRSCMLPEVNTKCITAVDCSILKIKDEIVSPQFFVYYTQSQGYFSKINSESSGTTRARITRKKLEEIELPVPPLSEQQRIVKRLDSAFAHIDTLKANAEKQLREARALFQKALERAMKPKEGWEEKKMSDIYDVRDGTHDSPKYQETGYPLVTSKNLRGGILDMTNVNLISETDYYAINNRSKVDVGDVLFAMIGTIGNPVLVQEEPNYAIKNMALFKVPANQSGDFLRYYLLNDNVLLKMQTDSKGTTQKFVSLGYLRGYQISIPSISTQQHIVARLDTLSANLREFEEIQRKIIAECDALKQALLRKVFE